MLKIISMFFYSLGELIIDFSYICENKKKILLFLFFLPFVSFYFLYICFFILINFIYYTFKFYIFKYKTIDNKNEFILELKKKKDFKNFWILYVYNIFYIFPNTICFSMFYQTFKFKQNSNFKQKYNIYLNNFILFNIKKVVTFFTQLPISVIKINIFLVNISYNVLTFNWDKYITVINTILLNILVIINEKYFYFQKYRIIFKNNEIVFNPKDNKIIDIPIKDVKEICKSIIGLNNYSQFIFFKNTTTNNNIVTHIGKCVVVDEENNKILVISESSKFFLKMYSNNGSVFLSKNVMKSIGTINSSVISYKTKPLLVDKNKLQLINPSIEDIKFFELPEHSSSFDAALVLQYNSEYMDLNEKNQLKLNKKNETLNEWFDNTDNLKKHIKDFNWSSKEFFYKNKSLFDDINNYNKQGDYVKAQLLENKLKHDIFIELYNNRYDFFHKYTDQNKNKNLLSLDNNDTNNE